MNVASPTSMEAGSRRRRRSPWLSAMLRRAWLVAAALGAFVFAQGVLLSLASWPLPTVHDEFSNLLAADTFRHGRVTNPTHPHWEHFETFHVIHQPSYASKYPPGQGAFLALGQLVIGEPLAGAWLLSALATMAIYWMLLGWTSPKWAAVGGLVFALHPSIQIAWGQSYWGGTLACFAGALVFGAALRMPHRLQVRDATAMATGAMLLAVSRPFEGLIFCLATGGWVAWRWLRDGLPSDWQRFALRCVAPQAMILAAGMTALGYYNHAVTGSALKLPYQVHEATYGMCPLFPWQAVAEPTYRHALIERFHRGWSMDWYYRQDTPAKWLATKWGMAQVAARFFAPGVLAIPLLLLIFRPHPWRTGRLAGPLAILALTLAITSVSIWNYPHYIAPAAPIAILLIVAGLRQAHVIARRSLKGTRLVEILLVAQACAFVAAAISYAERGQGWGREREAIVRQLSGTPERHLVFVHYAADHNPLEEWVYNDAAIDDSPIVWAREIDAQHDNELMRYFSDRKVSVLEPEGTTAKLQELRAPISTGDSNAAD